MNSLNEIISRLPKQIRYPLQALPETIISNTEEIRLYINQPIHIISSNNEITIEPDDRTFIDKEIITSTLNNLLDHSIYAYEEDIAKGFLTIAGGHRVGICGKTVINNGEITLIKDISSLNIRRSREIIGAADSVIEKLYGDTGLQNTIIVSPPKCGKTTLLRDIIRKISSYGLRVAVCDERSEIAGMFQGMPSYDLGPRTDVLDGCPKAEGMIMLIRSMSPDVIVTDEIGTAADLSAIEAAVCAGVKLITSIHGNTMDDIMNSKIGPLIKERIFTRLVFLTNIPVTGSVREVIYV